MASVNKDALRRLYLDEKRSIPDLAKVLGLTYYAVRTALIAAGIPLRSRADGVRAVAHKLGKHLLGKKRTFTAEWKKNLRAALRAHADKTAVGVSLKASGYVEVTRGPDKGRGLHRVIVEKKIGRRLGSNEVVHHRDERRANNDDTNLQVMSRAAHTSHHRRALKGVNHGER